jgi:hypothetical protein
MPKFPFVQQAASLRWEGGINLRSIRGIGFTKDA